VRAVTGSTRAHPAGARRLPGTAAQALLAARHGSAGSVARSSSRAASGLVTTYPSAVSVRASPASGARVRPRLAMSSCADRRREGRRVAALRSRTSIPAGRGPRRCERALAGRPGRCRGGRGRGRRGRAVHADGCASRLEPRKAQIGSPRRGLPVGAGERDALVAAGDGLHARGPPPPVSSLQT
jgi:hypothetical protein